MRIAVITNPLHTNYGGILQAYAMQIVLERMGHEVTIINRSQQKPIPYFKLPIYITKRLIYKYILHKPAVRIFEEFYCRKTHPIVCQHTQRFIQRHIHTRILHSPSQIKEGEYDALVVGSDQIWRPRYYKPIEIAYLSFAKKWKNTKRIAYAPSFGVDIWEYTPKQTIRCKELIKLFDLITVREDSGIKLCAEYYSVNATHVLDPTMLLQKNDYIKLIEIAHQSQSEGEMMAYILDINASIEKELSTVASQKQMKLFYTSSKADNPNAPLSERIQQPVERWLRGFMDAKFVITDSFHGCVFSIIFNKDFAVIGNNSRGISRVISLLKMYSLEKRLIKNIQDVSSLPPINWENVNNTRDKKIQESLKLFQAALSKK